MQPVTMVFGVLSQYLPVPTNQRSLNQVLMLLFVPSKSIFKQFLHNNNNHTDKQLRPAESDAYTECSIIPIHVLNGN